VSLPEENDIPVIGVDLVVDILVTGGAAEVDGAGFAEVGLEEVVELIEEFLAEGGLEGFAGFVNVGLQAGENAPGVVAGFDLHQVDVTGVAFDGGADEDVAQGSEELLFVGVGWHGTLWCGRM